MLSNKEDSRYPFPVPDFNETVSMIHHWKLVVVISGNYTISVLIRAQAEWYGKDTPKCNGLDNTEANFSFS